MEERSSRLHVFKPTIHFAVSELEVGRLWDRFLQLGANDQGVVTADALQDTNLTASDIFAKNVSAVILEPAKQTRGSQMSPHIVTHRPVLARHTICLQIR